MTMLSTKKKGHIVYSNIFKLSNLLDDDSISIDKVEVVTNTIRNMPKSLEETHDHRSQKHGNYRVKKQLVYL